MAFEQIYLRERRRLLDFPILKSFPSDKFLLVLITLDPIPSTCLPIVFANFMGNFATERALRRLPDRRLRDLAIPNNRDCSSINIFPTN